MQMASGGKSRVVHFHRLAPYVGDNGEAQVRVLGPQAPEMDYDDLMDKARFGLTRQEHRDLLSVPEEYLMCNKSFWEWPKENRGDFLLSDQGDLLLETNISDRLGSDS